MAVQEVAANVLVVDDQPAIRSFMSDALGAFGYQVGAAADADEAFELIARSRFDLVISDLRLPGVAGLDFVARLREIDAALRVIMLTGSGPLDDELRRVHAAGIAVLHKPIQLPQLQSALDAALGGRSA